MLPNLNPHYILHHPLLQKLYFLSFLLNAIPKPTAIDKPIPKEPVENSIPLFKFLTG